MEKVRIQDDLYTFVNQEKLDELVSVYSVVVENLISKSIKRKAQKKSYQRK